MCQHDINQNNSSIILSKRQTLVAPSTKYGVCAECGLSFRYIKKQDVYVLKEEEEGDEDFRNHL